jgi:hypothetical protein
MLFLIWWVPFCAGGFADRLLGLVTSYCIAKISGRNFLIKWDFTDLSNAFNINSKFNYYTEKPNIDRDLNLNNFEAKTYFQETDLELDWNNQNIMFWSSQNLLKHVRDNKKCKWVIENYNELISNTLREVLSDILIFNNAILSSINNLQFDIGIHLRIGDTQLFNPEKEAHFQIQIENIFSNIKAHISQSYSIFLASDCQLAYKLAANYFQFSHIPGNVVHSGLTNDRKADTDIAKVMIDFLTLAKHCKSLYIGWNTNFSRVAALYDTTRPIYNFEFSESQPIGLIDKNELYDYFSWGKY